MNIYDLYVTRADVVTLVGRRDQKRGAKVMAEGARIKE